MTTPAQRYQQAKKASTTLVNLLEDVDAIYSTYLRVKQRVDRGATTPDTHDKNLTTLETLETLLDERLTAAERTLKGALK